MTKIALQAHSLGWWQISAVSDHNPTEYNRVFLYHLIQIPLFQEKLLHKELCVALYSSNL